MPKAKKTRRSSYAAKLVKAQTARKVKEASGEVEEVKALDKAEKMLMQKAKFGKVRTGKKEEVATSAWAEAIEAPTLPPKPEVAKPSSKSKTGKSKRLAGAVEVERLKQTFEDPSFRSNPLAALRGVYD